MDANARARLVASIRRPAWSTIGALLVVLVALPMSAARAEAVDEPSPSELSSFDGRWQRVDENESDAARVAAIEEAITGLSWLMRQMASGVLRSTTAPPTEMEFIWDGERLYQGLQGRDGSSERPVVLDGRLRSGRDRRGEPFSWSWSWTKDGLRVHWEQHQAHGSNLYRLDGEDGRTLVVEHRINVTALSNVEPIVYQSRFTRSDRPHDAVRVPDVAAKRAQD